MPASTEALRPRVYIMDRTGVTTYHVYDAFNPGAANIHIQNVNVKLAQTSPGSFSILLEDSGGNLNPGVVPGCKVVIQAGKTQATFANLITGFIRTKETLREHTGTLRYRLTGMGTAIRFNERISNFFRMGARASFGSAVATQDPTMRASELLKDLVQDTDHMPVGGPLEDFLVSAIDDIVETLPSIREPFVTQAHIANQLADSTGTLWGVDQNNSVFMRYPTTQASGIKIKDTSSISDDVNTCYFLEDGSGWSFKDTIDMAEGFCNRIYGIGGTEFAVDQSQIIDNASASLMGSIIGMQFIPTQRRLNALSLLLSRDTNPVPVLGEIRIGGALPTDGALVGTFKIDQDQIGTSATVVDRIPLNIADSGLVVGAVHWLNLLPTGTPGNSVNWHHDNLTTHVSYSKLGNDPWLSSTRGYCFVTYSTNKVLAVADDSQSIEKFGVFETVMNLPWILEGKLMDRYLAAMLQWTARIKRIYEIKTISLPDALIFPNQLIKLTDTKAGLLDRDVEMNNVVYNFDVDGNSIGLNPGPTVQPIEYVGASEPPPPPPPPPPPDLPTPLRTITVPLSGGLGNWAALVAAVNAAIPGDHIIATDGVYTKTAQTFSNRDGTSANPIVVKPQTVGGAQINGTGVLRFDDCDYLMWYGFIHRHAADNAQAIRFDDCTNCRFGRNDVQLTGSAASYWLMIGSAGNNNRVDHNYFHDKTTDDAFVICTGFNEGSPAVLRPGPTNTLIECNHFKNNTGIGETVVLGVSGHAAQFYNTIFRHNLAEGVTGGVPPDGELLAVKSCGNIVFHNTFKNNIHNTVSLRHGTNNKIMCNYFENSGGVMMSGANHVILRNHFKGYNNTVSNDSWMNPIILRMGDENPQPPGAGYATVRNCAIAFNSIINGSGASGPTIPMVRWGFGGAGGVQPQNCTFDGNIINASTGMLFDFSPGVTIGTGPTANTIANNILFASGSAVYGDLTVGTHYTAADPLVTIGADGLYRIAVGSPARNKVAANAYAAHLTTDIDGESLGAALGDAGSDQYSTAAIAAMPLKVVTSAVVGPASP